MEDAVAALNKAWESGGKERENVEELHSFEFDVRILDNEGTDGLFAGPGYFTNNQTIRWDSKKGLMHYSNGKFGIMSAYSVLMHEVGHAKLDIGTSFSDWWYSSDAEYLFNDFFSKKYNNPEDKYLIKGIDADILRELGLNIRDYHGGYYIDVEGVFSTTPASNQDYDSKKAKVKSQAEEMKNFRYKAR